MSGEFGRVRDAIEMYCWDHSRHQEGREYCICCSAWMTDGHKPDCTIAVALHDVARLEIALRDLLDIYVAQLSVTGYADDFIAIVPQVATARALLRPADGERG